VIALSVPLVAAAWLLLGAGAAKCLRPIPAHRAIGTVVRAAGHREVAVPLGLVRLLGAAEVTGALVVLLAPWRTASWVVAASYASFAAFVLAAIRTGAPLSSCGCFGETGAPPTALHLAVDTGIAALAVAVATDPSAVAPRDALTAGSGLGLAASLALAVAGLALFGAVGARGLGRTPVRRVR
jgi:hypothetical protein